MNDKMEFLIPTGGCGYCCYEKIGKSLMVWQNQVNGEDVVENQVVITRLGRPIGKPKLMFSANSFAHGDSIGRYFGSCINYCPMCGRRLNDD